MTFVTFDIITQKPPIIFLQGEQNYMLYHLGHCVTNSLNNLNQEIY